MDGDGTNNGLMALFESARSQIARYLAAHGAGDAVDDLMQELALRISQNATGPIASPMSYIYRSATNLMIDYRRSQTQARQRDGSWAESFDRTSISADTSPPADRIVDGRQKLARLEKALHSLNPRARNILIKHRVDGMAQREIARELGLSLSTVEADLRAAYSLIGALRDQWDKAVGP